MKEQAPQDFAPAPCGMRIRVVVIAVVVFLAVLDVFLAFQFFRTNTPGRYTMLVGAFVPGIIVTVLLVGFGIQSYRLEGQKLRVLRRFHSPVYDLAGLSSIEARPDTMRGSRKIYGNDGVGSISGVYQSKAQGRFRCYLSDTQKAVLITLANGEKLVLSPEHTQPFIDAVKKRLG